MAKRKKGKILDGPKAAQAPKPADADAARRRNLILAVACVAVLCGGLLGLFAWMNWGGSGSGGTPASDGSNPRFVIDTSMGVITVELFPKKAPITVKNFQEYVEAGHYHGTIFHRVMSDFMIQGGGFLPGMKEKSDLFDPIKNESRNGLSNKRGTLAMARTDDPDSATAQFFINVVDNNNRLDRGPGNDGYAVFGKVIAGMEVVDLIRHVHVGNARGHQNVPVKDVVIKSIKSAN